MVTEAQDLDEIFEEALIEFNEAESAARDERYQCLEDRRFCFVAGAQWEGKFGDQFVNKPRLEINKVHMSVIRTINEYRNNRITVNFKPAGSSSANDRTAEFCNDLYRAAEQQSEAQEAYDVAFEDAASGGIGAWRLRAEYVDEYDDENEEQTIVFEQINDADQCVFFNSGCRRQDKSDATKCWVITPMSLKDFEAEFNQSPASWPQTITETEYDWHRENTVNVAEYYKVVTRPHTVHIYKMMNDEEERYTDDDFENNPELKKTLRAIGARLVRKKKTRRRRVHKYLMSGGGILEDCGVIAGDMIPIVVCFGKRNIVDGVERLSGRVRTSRDTQVIKNMQTSKLAEISALSSVEKPIFTEEQILGHSELWRRDNIDNNAYLLINETEDAAGMKMPPQPIAYTRVPQIPPALAALMQITDADMKDLLGNQQMGEELRSNLSGDAVQKVQDAIGMQDYIYMSNFAKAMKVSGRIWLGMAKDIYVEEGRKLKSIAQDGSESFVEIGRLIETESGEIEPEFDLKKASLEVVVDVGPSSSSKRSKMVRDITAFMPYATDQETQAVLTSMAIMNMEGDGVSDVREYFREKLIKMGVVKPSKEELQELSEAAANQPPDANQVYLESAAEAERAKAEKTRADTAHSIAKTKETEAKTIEILAGVENKNTETQLKVVDAVSNAGTVQPL